MPIFVGIRERRIQAMYNSTEPFVQHQRDRPPTQKPGRANHSAEFVVHRARAAVNDLPLLQYLDIFSPLFAQIPLEAH